MITRIGGIIMKKTLTILVAVLLIALSVTPAFAVESPKPTTANYQITIIPGDGGGSFDFTYKTPVDDDGSQTVHFTAKPDDGYEFAGWTFEGDYTILGDPSNPEIDILAKGDVKAYPKFVKTGSGSNSGGSKSEGGSENSAGKDTKVDTSSKSPKTGSPNYIYIGIASVALIGLLFITKKCYYKK